MSAELVSYRGCCHCGRVRFSFRSAAIVAGVRCNCSLCVRRAAVLSSAYIAREHFTPHHDPEALGLYLWNEHVLRNYFCRSCGIFVYIGDGEQAKDGYRVNLGCVEGLDVLALPITIIDGKSVPLLAAPSM